MAQDATLHIKMTPDIIKNLRFLAKERNQTMGELVRQAVNSCYQLDFLKLTIEQERAVSAYRSGFISIGKLSEVMGIHVLQLRSWLREHNINQNNSFNDLDVDNA